MVCSCTGNGLHAGKTSLGYDWRISSENQLSGRRGEGRQSDDGKVFMIEGGVIQQDFCRLCGSSKRVVGSWGYHHTHLFDDG